MLNKLIKYECLCAARSLLPIYASLILVAACIACFEQFILPLEGNLAWASTAYGIISMVYGAVAVAAIVMTILTIFQRFHQTLFGNEGYLIHTLPVKPGTLIQSRLFSALLWVAAGILSGTCSLLVMELIRGNGITSVQEIGKNIPAYLLIEGVFIMIFALCSGILLVFCSIAVYNTFSKYKLAAGFIMFGGCAAIQLTIYGIGISAGWAIYMNTLGTNITPGPHEEFFLTQGYALGNIAYLALFTILYYILLNYLLKKHLDLA